MRPADEIERLLTGLQDRTSTAFDERTLSEMFSALETSTSGTPARSWREAGRAIMQSRITKFAAAAVLLLAVLLLARHLTGRETPASPGDRSNPIAQVPGNHEVPAPVAATQEQKLTQLARELDSARQLFIAADAKGLLRLLETGQDQTKIAVANYLAQMGEESALPALQRLADQWQGPVDDNPFRKSIDQIRNASRQEGAGGEDPMPSTGGYDPRIIVQVSDKATGTPIASAEIETHVYTGEVEDRMYAADEKGVFILDLTGVAPEYTRITVRSAGYVAQYVQYWSVCAQSLPKTVHFALEKGVVVGGVVQDPLGLPVEGATVRLNFGEDQSETPGEPHVFGSVKMTTDDQGRWRSSGIPDLIGDIRFSVEHPEFADAQFQMPRELTLKDLRAERAVMVLNKGVTVVGRVTDAGGASIVGADVLADYSYSDDAWAQTDANGCFSVVLRQDHTVPKKFLLTVQAPGFTAQQKDLPLREDLEPVDFILQPARLLIGRVVDSEGKPLADVSVEAAEWNGSRTIKWQGKTDPNGMFVWDYPPADAVRIDLNKTGYLRSWPEVVADDQEHTFVLTRPMTIQGTVTDSRTGEPIPRFSVTPGIQHDRDSLMRWSTSEPYLTKWFTDGRYSYTMPSAGRAYAVRIEADGYLPQDSRVVDANEQGATIDVTLTQGRRPSKGEDRGPSGYVFDANACPVAGAQVVWSETVLIYGSRAEVHGRIHTTTDQQGYFAFTAADRQDLFGTRNGQAPFLAICDRGIGGASCEEFAQNGFILLKPWARVQGQRWVGSRPAANQRLYLSFWYDAGLSQAMPDRYEAVTDEDGRFVFEKVLPGKFTLCNETHTVLPGQTLELQLGGGGRTVKGELAVPAASHIPISVSLEIVSVNAPVPFDEIAKPSGYERMSFDEVQRWIWSLQGSSEGRDWLEKTYPARNKRLRVEVDEQRRFHLDNVEPGTYAVRGTVTNMAQDGGRLTSSSVRSGLMWQPEIIGYLWHPFEVPPFANSGEMDIPLDLGTASVPAALKRGDPAPDFDLPTFGVDRVRLKDCRGKVVLLTFSHWNQRSLQEPRDAYACFHADPKYAQISLMVTQYLLLGKKAVDERLIEWPYGLLDADGGETAMDYGVQSWMSRNILIGAQGQILAMDLSGEDLELAIEDAIQAAR